MPAFVSCSGGGGVENQPKEPTISMWAGHGYDKLREEMSMPDDASTDHIVYIAKNESEAANIALRSDADTELLNFKVVSGNNEHVSVSVYHARPVLKLKRKVYTDPLAPLGAGSRFKLEADKTMAILVDFKTTAETPAGDYLYEFAVTDSKGNVLNKVKITLHVWNFAMPEDVTFQTSIGGNIHKTLYDLLLEHNMCERQLPYDILDPRADEYMSNPRVTAFRIPFWDGNTSDEKLVEYYNKLKTNPVWFEKAFFYPVDEPSTPEAAKKLTDYCVHLSELCPGIRITSPYYKNVQMTPELDQIDYMDQYMDLHCPKLSNWDDDTIYSAEQKERYPSFADRMTAMQEKGETVWTYVCNYPLAPYLNVKVDDEGLGSRVLFWQMYQRNIEGFLYWNSCYYSRLPNNDPWSSVDTFGNGIYGDGILVYPGAEIGAPGTYLPSIRLKIMRDGIEDIELLYLAENMFGREWVDERANKVSKSLTTVDVTSDELAALRIEIGNAIEKEMNK